MILSTTVTARLLGVDLDPDDDNEVRVAIIKGPEIERAARTRAVERWPLRDGEVHDGGTDDCPAAGVRHVLAGALVSALATGMGFPYGTPPPADERDTGRVPLHARRADYDEAYPDAPHYAVAEHVVEALLGVSSTRDAEGPSNDRTPEAIHVAAVDLAIDLLCGAASMAEITAGAAAWLLASQRSSWAAARARRMCSVVGARFDGPRS